MLRDFLLIVLPLFVVIDPAGMLPLFVAVTERFGRQVRRDIARRATLVAMIVGVSFLVIGQAVFKFLHVEVYDFQIAGGLIVVVLAILDVLSPGKPAVDEEEIQHAHEAAVPNISIVPLAIPLIVGPATMTTSLLLVETYSPKYGPVLAILLVAAALVLNCVVLFGIMWHSDLVVRLLGKQTLSVINKVVMILLAAIAVSLIRQGIVSIVHEVGVH